MRPGGWPFRRRLLARCLALAAGLSLAPTGGSNAIASGNDTAKSGDQGTGVPPFRFVIPRSARLSFTTIQWSDVPKDLWARRAIDFVGGTNDWMRDFPPNKDGTYPFRPNRIESRQLFARALVDAFAPDVAVDPNLHFTDLPDDSRFYPSANVAAQEGWIKPVDGAFLPTEGVSMALVHHATVFALGLKSAAKGLNEIHTHNGFVFDTPSKFGTVLIGMRLGLRYNHWDESLDVNPADLLPRSEVAWSLFRAKTLSADAIASMQSYATIELPTMGPRKRRLIQWGIDFVGYPYVWGGEWDTATGSGYCCGTQPVGGFDCSGFAWWIMRHAGNGWDNRPPRPYAGWDLPQRVANDMAIVGNISWKRLEVGDLMFYDGDGDGIIDHVDTYIGNGWALDSSSTPAGVTIMWVGTGWYHDHFVRGRRLIT
ncbi:MAG: C40 family peptidase [Actinobacteria bacterium]|nr:C40 family peptidase [Actinomycetota bacterium]